MLASVGRERDEAPVAAVAERLVDEDGPAEDPVDPAAGFVRPLRGRRSARAAETAGEADGGRAGRREEARRSIPPTPAVAAKCVPERKTRVERRKSNRGPPPDTPVWISRPFLETDEVGVVGLSVSLAVGLGGVGRDYDAVGVSVRTPFVRTVRGGSRLARFGRPVDARVVLGSGGRPGIGVLRVRQRVGCRALVLEGDVPAEFGDGPTARAV